MYNVYGLGKRIASFRKRVGLTQEELAEKLNITGQAVSKWENEISFPDVTLLPEIASVLNTTMEKLFGNENAHGTRLDPYAVFPKSKGNNMNLAQVYEGTACYSEKETETVQGEKVFFKDGSHADLRELIVVNKGSGEISFDFNDSLQFLGMDHTHKELHEVYDNISSIDVTLNTADFSVMPSSDQKTTVKASGTAYFIEGLVIEKKDQSLVIQYTKNDQGNRGTGGVNKITVFLGTETGKSIKGTFNGSGEIGFDVPFEQGQLTINGSGDIRIKNMGTFEGRINGSGNISCGSVDTGKIAINGSGDFSCDTCTESFSASINGSGDVTIREGEVRTLNLAVRGSGDVDASSVTTDYADISIAGSGDVVVGHVVKESKEKHSKNSTIRILKRG